MRPPTQYNTVNWSSGLLSHGHRPLQRFTGGLVQALPQRGLQQCHRGDDRGAILLRLEKPARLQNLGQTHLVRDGLQDTGEFENERAVFRQYVRPPNGLDTDAWAGELSKLRYDRNQPKWLPIWPGRCLLRARCRETQFKMRIGRRRIHDHDGGAVNERVYLCTHAIAEINDICRRNRHEAYGFRQRKYILAVEGQHVERGREEAKPAVRARREERQDRLGILSRSKEDGDEARGPLGASPLDNSTWKNPPGFPISGGGAWTSFTLDPDSALLYIPVGNPAPDFAIEVREGENFYTDSVVVLDARTGAYKLISSSCPGAGTTGTLPTRRPSSTQAWRARGRQAAHNFARPVPSR